MTPMNEEVETNHPEYERMAALRFAFSLFFHPLHGILEKRENP